MTLPSMHPGLSTSYETVPEFLSGGGEMGQRIREFDWTTTTLGPPQQWPQSLKTCIRIMLTSQQPIWIGWGKQLIKFYNDPYKDIVRGKHPWALGTPASVVWKEIWNDIAPMLTQVMEKNEGTYVESQLLIMERNGYPEETYYTFSYTPIPGDQGGTEGMFCANSDDTEKIISQRQLKTLTQLGKTLIDSDSTMEVIKDTIEILKENEHDFPFAFYCSIEKNLATFEYSSSPYVGRNLVEGQITLNQPSEFAVAINEAVTSRKIQVIENARKKFGDLPKGGWDVSPDKILVVPIMQAAIKDPYGVLFVGANPFRLLDEKYRSFFSLVADQVSTSLTQVNVLEEERKRVAALAEIDKAKTIFFTNISHEFRTPLTLMLGSLEEFLNRPALMNDAEKKTLETTHRNALRLLRLVNNLLDFSRLEAGRSKAQFQLTDIVQFTSDIASNFRAVAEAAGLQFSIEADTINAPVYIDKEMWEKIVLNLLSNAFKYTLQGGIALNLGCENDRVIFKVKDTGVGIPESELPKMFQRFHRVENITGRSFEGTGIGLSLVKELVQLHSGDIRVSSKVGEGSEFIISIPTGKHHLPIEHVVEVDTDFHATLSDAFVEEAKALIDMSAQEEGQQLDEQRARILVVDDNIDMRDHIKGILQKKFQVVTAGNGAEALDKIKSTSPALIVSDIMMPVMDGIQLLKHVKGNAETATLPVILVSARAGEESRIEGYEIGADDYLVKPFSSKELLARVSAQVELSRKRKSVENELHNLFIQAPTAIQILRGPEFIYELANDRSLQILGTTADKVIGRKVIDVVPNAEEQGLLKILNTVYETGERLVFDEVPITLTKDGKDVKIFYKAVYQPLRDDTGKIVGIMITGDDITQQVMARKDMEDSNERFRTLAETLPQMVWMRNVDGTIEYASSKWKEYTGLDDIKKAWPQMTHPDDWELVMKVWEEANSSGAAFRQEVRMKNVNGEYRWHYATGEPVKDETGKVTKWIGALTDIHVQKTFAQNLERLVSERTEELRVKNIQLQNSQSFLEQLINSSVEYISVLDNNLDYITVNKRFEDSMNLKKEEIKGKNLIEVNPRAVDHVRLDSIRQALRGETVYLDKRPSLARPDIYVDTYFIPLRIQDNIEGVIIMARDVTDIVRTEKLLEQKNEELLRSNEDLQQFAHVASHDLKEPVRKVRTFANRLSREFATSLNDNGRIYLAKMEKAADRMYTMIDGVLKYSSLTTIDDDYELVSLSETIEAIKADLEVIIEEKRATIEYTELPTIVGSSILLYQLFYNLIFNSLKFARPGVPPILSIHAEQGEMNLPSKNDDVYVRIMIRDNGIGFSNADAAKIFMPFSRLNSKDKFEGTGLGLALCKKIVERHRGTITATGVEGEGSVFEIVLPRNNPRSVS